MAMDAPRNRNVFILDTTLRDGDQAAGFAFDLETKLAIARSIAACGVDAVEAGFPASSPFDFEACRLVSEALRVPPGQGAHGGPLVAVMCRAIPEEIALASRALAYPERGILHVSLPVSDVHIRAKFGKSRAWVLERAREAARVASSLALEVEMGAEDATRADPSFLAEYCDACVSSGARSVNVADTLGLARPDGFARLVRALLASVPAFACGRAALSVHCHNDLGLATANTIAAIDSGATRVEVSAMGLGERAGNAPLEEIAASLASRGRPAEFETYGERGDDVDLGAIRTGLVPARIGALCALVADRSGTSLSPLKPVTGSNVRAHASGIHQDGIAKDPTTYAAHRLGDFDAARERIVLSRHSGRAGVATAAREYAGIRLDDEAASSILAVMKGESEVDPWGVTGFLRLLARRGLVSAPLYACRSIRLELSADVGSIPVSAPSATVTAIIDTLAGGETASSRGITVSAETACDAALGIANALGPAPISLGLVGYSGFASFASRPEGAGRAVRGRVYLEATAPVAPLLDDRRFSIERVGECRELQLLEALLDVVNSLSCLRAAETGRTGSERAPCRK